MTSSVLRQYRVLVVKVPQEVILVNFSCIAGVLVSITSMFIEKVVSPDSFSFQCLKWIVSQVGTFIKVESDLLSSFLHSCCKLILKGDRFFVMLDVN